MFLRFVSFNSITVSTKQLQILISIRPAFAFGDDMTHLKILYPVPVPATPVHPFLLTIQNFLIRSMQLVRHASHNLKVITGKDGAVLECALHQKSHSSSGR